MSTSLLLTGALSWVGGGSWALRRALPSSAPSPSSSRDDVIGKVCLTKDALAAHPKGKIPGGSPLLLPSSGLPPLSSLVSPVPAFPLPRDPPCSRLLQARAQGKPLLPSPEGPYTHLCALGPVPPSGGTASPRAKGALRPLPPVQGAPQAPLLSCRGPPSQLAPLSRPRSSQPALASLPKSEPLASGWAGLGWRPLDGS